jgi:hypothetical protein
MSKDKKPAEKNLDKAEEPDYSEGFGGLPDESSLTDNLGCVPERPKTKKKPTWKEAE